MSKPSTLSTDVFACGRVRPNRRTHRRSPELLVVQETLLVTQPLLAWIRIHSGLLSLDDGRKIAFGKRGRSDFFAARRWDGRFVAVEFKAKGKKGTATPDQLDFLEAVRSNGGIGILADCVEDVLNQVIPPWAFGGCPGAIIDAFRRDNPSFVVDNTHEWSRRAIGDKT